ncbi:MAG: zinc ribbon domain-containing protein [Thermodesulfovibrionia bacterium]|nr:zinc ribbon domain-containing protein [Thermodesulfovibrionia bacterium]
MLNSNYICQECKKPFTHSSTKRDFEDASYMCPHCGSNRVEKGGLLEFFKRICSGGG